MTGPAIAYPLLYDGNESVPPSAKAFRVERIDMRTARDLNRAWHSLLPRTDLGNLLCGNTSAAFAAEYGGRYWAVAIWSQPIIRQVAADGVTIELRRLAVCDAAPPNTASRVLAVCRRLVKRAFPEMERAVSYLAVDVHAGTIYRAAGWTPVGEVCPARPQRMTGCKQRATGPLQTASAKQRWEIAL